MQKKTIEAAKKAYEAALAKNFTSTQAQMEVSAALGLSVAMVRKTLRMAYNGNKGAQPSNWRKLARKTARDEAEKRNLDKSIYKTLSWWRKLLAKLFPALKRKYDKWAKWAHKRTIKKWSREVYAYNVVEREERMRLLRAQRRLSKAHTRKVLEDAAKVRAAKGQKYDHWGRLVTETTTAEEKA
jgi:hypothetical protein